MRKNAKIALFAVILLATPILVCAQDEGYLEGERGGWLAEYLYDNDDPGENIQPVINVDVSAERVKLSVLENGERSTWRYSGKVGGDDAYSSPAAFFDERNQFDVLVEFRQPSEDGTKMEPWTNINSVTINITVESEQISWSSVVACQLSTQQGSLLLSQCFPGMGEFRFLGDNLSTYDYIAITFPEISSGGKQYRIYDPRYVKLSKKAAEVSYKLDGATYTTLGQKSKLDFKLLDEDYYFIRVVNTYGELLKWGISEDLAGIRVTENHSIKTALGGNYNYRGLIAEGSEAIVDLLGTFDSRYAVRADTSGYFTLFFEDEYNNRYERPVNYSFSFDPTRITKKCLDITFAQDGEEGYEYSIGDDGSWFDIVSVHVAKAKTGIHEACPIDMVFDVELVPGQESEDLRQHVYATTYPWAGSGKGQGGYYEDTLEVLIFGNKSFTGKNTVQYVSENTEPCGFPDSMVGFGTLDNIVKYQARDWQDTICHYGLQKGSTRFFLATFLDDNSVVYEPGKFNLTLKITPYIYLDPVSLQVTNAFIEQSMELGVKRECLAKAYPYPLRGTVEYDPTGGSGKFQFRNGSGLYVNRCPFPVDVSSLSLLDTTQNDTMFDECTRFSKERCNNIFAYLNASSKDYTTQGDEPRVFSNETFDAYEYLEVSGKYGGIPPYYTSCPDCATNKSMVEEFINYASDKISSLEIADFFYMNFTPEISICYSPKDSDVEICSSDLVDLSVCRYCGQNQYNPQIMTTNAWGQPVWLFYLQSRPPTAIHSADCEGNGESVLSHGGYCDAEQSAFAIMKRAEIIKRFSDAYLRAIVRASQDSSDWYPSSLSSSSPLSALGAAAGCNLVGGATSDQILGCAIGNLNGTIHRATVAPQYLSDNTFDSYLAAHILNEMHDTMIDLISDFDGTTHDYDDYLHGAGVFGKTDLRECTQLRSADYYHFIRGFPQGLTAESPQVVLDQSKVGTVVYNAEEMPPVNTLGNSKIIRFDYSPPVSQYVTSIGLNITDLREIYLVYADVSLKTKNKTIESPGQGIVDKGEVYMPLNESILLDPEETYEITVHVKGCTESMCGTGIRSLEINSVVLNLQWTKVRKSHELAKSFMHLLQCLKGEGSQYKVSMLNDKLTGDILSGMVQHELRNYLSEKNSNFTHGYERTRGLWLDARPGEIGAGTDVEISNIYCGTNEIDIAFKYPDNYRGYSESDSSEFYSGYADSKGYTLVVNASPATSAQEYSNKTPYVGACDVPGGSNEAVDKIDVGGEGQSTGGNEPVYSEVNETMGLFKSPDFLPFYFAIDMSNATRANKALQYYAPDQDGDGEPNASVTRFFAEQLYPGYVDAATFYRRRAATISPEKTNLIEQMGSNWILDNTEGLAQWAHQHKNMLKTYVCEASANTSAVKESPFLNLNYHDMSGEDCGTLLADKRLGNVMDAYGINKSAWLGFYNNPKVHAAVFIVVKPIVFTPQGANSWTYSKFVPQIYVVAKNNDYLNDVLTEIAKFWRGELPGNMLFMYKNMSTFWLFSGARVQCDLESATALEYAFTKDSSLDFEVDLGTAISQDGPCRIDGDQSKEAVLGLMRLATIVSGVNNNTTASRLPEDWAMYYRHVSNRCGGDHSCEAQKILAPNVEERQGAVGARFYDIRWEAFGEIAPYFEVSTNSYSVQTSSASQILKSNPPCDSSGYCQIKVSIPKIQFLNQLTHPDTGIRLSEYAEEQIGGERYSNYNGYVSMDYSRAGATPLKVFFNLTFQTTGSFAWIIPILGEG